MNRLICAIDFIANVYTGCITMGGMEKTVKNVKISAFNEKFVKVLFHSSSKQSKTSKQLLHV